MKKHYTTLEQSVILEKVIDPNTADMHYWESEGKLYTYVGKREDVNGIPCWSVGALIDLLPDEIDDGGTICYLSLGKNWISYEGCDRYDSSVMVQPVVYKDEPLVELLYKMICWLTSKRIL